MELKEGMYVRTKNGIAKVKEIKDDTVHKTKWITLDKAIDLTSFLVREQEILKASFNIIDLIEVGDYVNGEQVSRIKQCPEYHLEDGILIFNEHNKTIYSNFRTSKYYDITSIVTKEQFEQMEYKI